MKRLSIIILSVITILASCIREEIENRGKLRTGDNSLVLRIGTVPYQASVKAVGNDSAQVGSSFNSLRIWLVNKDNMVSRFMRKAYEQTSTTTEVIEGLQNGSYTMYIVANSDILDAYEEGSVIDDGFRNRVMNMYDYLSNDMPLSYSGTVEIVRGENQAEASLKRTSGRYSVRIFNHSSIYPIEISRCELSSFKADRTYIFDKGGTVPEGTGYLGFPSVGRKIYAPQTNNYIFDEFLFEGQAPSYRINLEGLVFNGSSGSGPEMNISASNIQYSGMQYGKENLFVIENAGTSHCLYFDKESGKLKAGVSRDEINSQTNKTDYLFFFIMDNSHYNATWNHYLYNFNGKIFDNITSLGFQDGMPQWGMKYLKGNNTEIYFTTDTGKYLGENENSIFTGAWDYDTHTTEWKLYPASTNIVSWFSRTLDISKVGERGYPVSLNEIKRNQHLVTTVNIFYSTQSEQIEFAVEGWTNASGSLTYN